MPLCEGMTSVAVVRFCSLRASLDPDYNFFNHSTASVLFPALSFRNLLILNLHQSRMLIYSSTG